MEYSGSMPSYSKGSKEVALLMEEPYIMKEKYYIIMSLDYLLIVTVTNGFC